MKQTGSFKKWLWWFSLIAASVLLWRTSQNVGGLIGGIQSLIGILTPFVIGFIITFILYAPCNRLELTFKRSRLSCIRRGARIIAVIVCYVAFVAIIGGLLVLLLPALYTAIVAFFKNLPTYYAEFSKKLSAVTATGWLQRLQINERLQSLYTGAYQALVSLANTENMLTVVKSAMSVTSGVLSVLMSFIVSIYMLSQREVLLGAVKSLFGAFLSERWMKGITLYLHKTAQIFYNYLYGAALDAAVVAVIMTVGMLLFRLPHPVLLGCFIGLMNFIPYFGSIIAGVLVVLVALFTKNIYTAIGVAVYILVMQQLDGNIIQPRIIGQSVGVRPIYVLLAITVGGGLFGFLGILFSVPTMAVIIMLLQDLIAYRNRKKAAKAEEIPPTEE